MAKPQHHMSQENLRAILVDLLLQRGESLGEFGTVLARTIEENKAPYSRQYIYRLKAGQDIITDEIANALMVLGAMADGIGELQARARPTQVLAIHELPPHVIIMGKARGCSLPGCRIRYVPASPAQRYCSSECRAEAARRRRIVARRLAD